jgi:hypothetical protein
MPASAGPEVRRIADPAAANRTEAGPTSLWFPHRGSHNTLAILPHPKRDAARIRFHDIAARARIHYAVSTTRPQEM